MYPVDQELHNVTKKQSIQPEEIRGSKNAITLYSFQQARSILQHMWGQVITTKPQVNNQIVATADQLQNFCGFI